MGSCDLRPLLKKSSVHPTSLEGDDAARWASTIFSNFFYGICNSQGYHWRAKGTCEKLTKTHKHPTLLYQWFGQETTSRTMGQPTISSHFSDHSSSFFKETHSWCWNRHSQASDNKIPKFFLGFLSSSQTLTLPQRSWLRAMHLHVYSFLFVSISLFLTKYGSNTLDSCYAQWFMWLRKVIP